MKLGIIGLPNAGKSTIFNALSKGNAKVENYPFTTIDPNIGSVAVPDSRLKEIGDIFKPERLVQANVDFLDIAGLVKGASQGEGLGNKFLENIRTTDAIVHVVRCFEDEDVAHSYGNVDPLRDIDIINTELILADLDIVERNIKVKEKARLNDKQLQAVYEELVYFKDCLGKGELLKDANLDENQQKTAKEYGLLTSKKILYVCNCNEDMLLKEDEIIGNISKKIPAYEILVLCGQWEAELIGLDPETQKEFMNDAGVNELGLHKLISASYKLLDLVTFFSSQSQEVRAWSIKNGTKAPEAAGTIHSDMEKGYIKAEVIPYKALMKWKDPHKVKEAGAIKFEGKEYIVEDGDIIKFHFKS